MSDPTALTPKDRLVTAARLGVRTRLLFNLRPKGALALVRTFMAKEQNPSQIYRVHAENSPDKIAIISPKESITFKELDRRIDGLAAGLRERGVKRGASVLLMMKNRPEFTIAQIAVGRVGASAVSVPWRSAPAEVAYLAEHSGAVLAIFDGEFTDVIRAAKKEANLALGEVTTTGDVAGTTRFADLVETRIGSGSVKDESDNAAVVVYTSGTTGKPKGAVRKFSKAAIFGAMRFLSETPMRNDDVHLVACPLYHTTAFGFLSLTHLIGGTVLLLEEFKAETFLAAVEKYRVTTTAIVPTMLHRLLEAKGSFDTSSLRAIFAAGAPLSGELAIKTMDRFGDVVFNIYGATETGSVTMATPDDLRKAPGTIGKAVPGNEIRLYDDEGRVVGKGGVGELYVRNALLVAGYHKDDGATAASQREGFFSVGDLARVDDEGRYFIEGRKRDMIISGGVNVYPAEVEAALEAHPKIAEAAVVGVADAEWGERVRAFVAPHAGMTLDSAELGVWIRTRLSGAKVPRDFIVLEALPRNPTGKVLKRELREHRG